MMTITQEELKRLLHYDPETGRFIWMVSRGGAVKAGEVAGTVNNSRGIMNIVIYINGRNYLAHRLAWLYMIGEFPRDGEIISHVDGDGLDSRWSNLTKTVRIGTKYRSNKSGICGVHWAKRDRRWTVQITINKKVTHLGRFDTIFDAACARKSAELNLK